MSTTSASGGLACIVPVEVPLGLDVAAGVLGACVVVEQAASMTTARMPAPMDPGRDRRCERSFALLRSNTFTHLPEHLRRTTEILLSPARVRSSQNRPTALKDLVLLMAW
jgi:hypothetical protein